MIRSPWWRSCLTGALATVWISGCASPGSTGPSLAAKIKETEAVRTASYQQEPSESRFSKKAHDPISLKLKYAKWMEEIENYGEAQANYNIVLEQRPQDVEAILGLARIDQVAGRVVEAEAGFKQALTLQPQSPLAQNALGQFYASQERWQQALPLLSDAMMGDPTNKAFRFQLAVALAESGDIPAAFPHFRQSVGDVAAHFNVGTILKQQGQYRQAEQQFLQALTKDPNLEAARQAATEMRQLALAAEAYAGQQHALPQVQPASHQNQQTLTPTGQEQLRNQRPLPR